MRKLLEQPSYLRAARKSQVPIYNGVNLTTYFRSRYTPVSRRALISIEELETNN